MKAVGDRELLPLRSLSLRKLNHDAYTLIDVRPRSEFISSHIAAAINIHCSPLLIRRLQRGSKSVENLFLPDEIRRKLQRDTSQMIVLYDNDSVEGNIAKEVRQLARVLQNGKRSRSIFFLDGGIKSFMSENPLLCESTPLTIETDQQISQMRQIRDPTDHVLFSSYETEPVHLLPHLFIGSAQHAEKREMLQRLGITAILNVSKTCNNNFEDTFTYKTIPVDDSFTEDIGCYFGETSNFIDSVRRQNGKVLVHCKAGISRSVTICLAYLISVYGFSFDEAYEFIKKKKSHISPNFNFLGQLLLLESNKSRCIARQRPLETPLLDSEVPSSPRVPLESLHPNSPLPHRQTFSYPVDQTGSCLGPFLVSNIGSNSPKLMPTPT